MAKNSNALCPVRPPQTAIGRATDQLGHCRGARPSRWPFSPSRQKPFPKLNGFTSSLIPAFSPRRRRNVRRLFEKSATGLAGRSTAKSGRPNGGSSPGGEARMRAGVNTNFHSALSSFVHPKLPLAGAGARPPTGTLPGSAPVPVAVFGVAPENRPERGLSQSAARRQTNQYQNDSKRLPAFHPLRVGTTRAPLKIPSAVRRGIFVESKTKINFSPVGAASSGLCGRPP